MCQVLKDTIRNMRKDTVARSGRPRNKVRHRTRLFIAPKLAVDQQRWTVDEAYRSRVGTGTPLVEPALLFLTFLFLSLSSSSSFSSHFIVLFLHHSLLFIVLFLFI
jgi:hypothetical protein